MLYLEQKFTFLASLEFLQRNLKWVNCFEFFEVTKNIVYDCNVLMQFSDKRWPSACTKGLNQRLETIVLRTIYNIALFN